MSDRTFCDYCDKDLSHENNYRTGLTRQVRVEGKKCLNLQIVLTRYGSSVDICSNCLKEGLERAAEAA